MRKIIITLLFILMIISEMMFYTSLRINKDINKKIDDYKEVEVEKIKKEKQEELDKLKEENKNKYNRYEEIETWNQEVLDYIK
jgi:hypothetical protein